MNPTWYLPIFYRSRSEIVPGVVAFAKHFSGVADDFFNDARQKEKKQQLTSLLIYSIYGMKRNKTSCTLYFSPSPTPFLEDYF